MTQHSASSELTRDLVWKWDKTTRSWTQWLACAYLRPYPRNQISPEPLTCPCLLYEQGRVEGSKTSCFEANFHSGKPLIVGYHSDSKIIWTPACEVWHRFAKKKWQ